MTDSLRRAIEQVEQLPPESQDAIAEVIRREVEDRERRRRDGRAALDRLVTLGEEVRRAGHAPVDAVQLVREGRDELDRRLMSWWQS
jgi:hypothetical protein